MPNYRLWQVVPRMMGASPCRSNRAERFTLALLMKMARRRRIEERLGVRNQSLLRITRQILFDLAIFPVALRLRELSSLWMR
jgi:hypothetical protein